MTTEARVGLRACAAQWVEDSKGLRAGHGTAHAIAVREACHLASNQIVEARKPPKKTIQCSPRNVLSHPTVQAICFL